MKDVRWLFLAALSVLVLLIGTIYQHRQRVVSVEIKSLPPFFGRAASPRKWKWTGVRAQRVFDGWKMGAWSSACNSHLASGDGGFRVRAVRADGRIWKRNFNVHDGYTGHDRESSSCELTPKSRAFYARLLARTPPTSK